MNAAPCIRPFQLPLPSTVRPARRPPAALPSTSSSRPHTHPATRGATICAALRPDETPEQALERRIRESDRVDERVTYVCNEAEWQSQVDKAGDRLMVVEIHSEEVCQTGFNEEAEIHWEVDKKLALEPCRNMKHTFARTARDCPDVVFLAVEADSDGGQALCDRLGVDVLPTLQFWRNDKMLWEHRGVVALDQDLGEGVLYFGDTAANNEKASSFIKDLHSRDDLQAFVASAAPTELAVVDVSLTDAAPCVHIFPAVLALARSFVGFASFARLMGDENAELKEVMAELEVTQVPTFLFYRGGKIVGRHVGSSRGDLIGQILGQQAAAGIKPPPPTNPRRSTPRRRTVESKR